MLALDRIGKTYPNGVHAIDGISLEIESGEIVVIIGGSGCGCGSSTCDRCSSERRWALQVVAKKNRLINI